MESKAGNSLLEDFSYKDISPQVAPGSPGICDVWIPDPSVPSKKRADPGEHQDTSNCMRARKKEKFVICFRNKAKALFFGGQHFSCFYCKRLLMCKSRVLAFMVMLRNAEGRLS